MGEAIGKITLPATYTLTLNAGFGGTVSRYPDETIYNLGEEVTIYAAPDSKHTFTGWTGGKVANAAYANTTVIMNSDMTVTANFRPTSSIVYDTLIDARDGKAYKTARMPDGLVWMAENLNHQPQTGNARCYDNSADSCDKYGRLYDKETARKVCPSGWHLSTRREWNNLCQAAGGEMQREDHGLIIWKDAGRRLKAKSGWRDFDGWLSYRNTGESGEDNYGFSALPGGIYIDKYYFGGYQSGRFIDAGYRGDWWVDDGYDDDEGYDYNGKTMDYNRTQVLEHSNVFYVTNIGLIIGGGRSVRCVQNTTCTMSHPAEEPILR
jgi:uncharacterized protein (TIGR02145 family)